MSTEAPDQRVFFITFRTYGTWLHGDARGSVDRRHNAPGAQRITRHSGLESWEANSLASPPFVLTDLQRERCECALHRLAARKNWRLLAANVRTNHVHVVIVAPGSGERVMNAIKASMTAQLRRDELVGPNARIWARHGSIQSLSGAKAVARTADYTANGQGRGGFLGISE